MDSQMNKLNLTENKNGFTLIELMITVLIVGIMSVFGYNSYRSSVIKSNRADAKGKLLEVMQRQERYFSEKSTYTTNLADIGYSGATVLSDKANYLLTATAAAGGLNSGLIITAVPQGNQVKDTACMNFILSSTGQKTVSTASTTCW